MKYLGHDQVHILKREQHLFDTTHGADWDLIRYFLFVAFLITFFSIVHAYIKPWKQAAFSIYFIKPAHAIGYIEPDLAPLPERDANIALIKKIWGTDSGTGLQLARCESGYRTEAKNDNINGTQDQGVFQVNTTHNMPDMFNATANISYAYILYKDQGTTPWNSSASCWKE